jgi:type II secretory pathway component PulM
MLNSVTETFERLSERERRIIIAGAIAALAVLIFAVVTPLQRSVTSAQQRIEHKRDDLVWLKTMAPRLGALPLSTPQPLRESLVVLVDRTAREAGIGKSLVGSQPSSNGALNVHFEQVPFDGLASWLTQIGDRYGVRAQSATIDAAASGGIVNATLVLQTH